MSKQRLGIKHPRTRDSPWISPVPFKKSKAFDNWEMMQQRSTIAARNHSFSKQTPIAKKSWAGKLKSRLVGGFANHFVVPVAQGFVGYAKDRQFGKRTFSRR